MNLLLSLSLLFAASSAFAELTVDVENKSYHCDKKSNAIFHCLNGDKKILVTKNLMGFTAVVKEGTSLPEIKWISKVSEDDKILFEIPKINIPGVKTTEVNPQNRSGKLMNAMGVAGHLKGIDDDLARAFLQESQAFIENEKAAKSKVIISSGDKKYNCTRGEDRPLTAEEKKSQTEYGMKMQCNFYACKNDKGEQVLGYVPAPNTYGSPYFLNLKGENTELRFDDMTILDSQDEKGKPLFSLPKFNVSVTSSSGLNENLFIPAKFERNKTTFSFYTNPFTEPMREAAASLCSGSDELKKLLAEDKRTAEVFQNELATMELSHYLTLVNGQMMAMYIDAAKSKGLGCRYGEMILSKEAAAHLEWLEKAKARPVQKFLTEEEVQDLFQQAKNMPDIPFGYKYDGCYARAHVMARRFEAMGIPTEKVWIKGTLSVPGTDIQWNYHVAPVINVKTKSGEIKKFVIDPSLNDKAVTVDGWVDSMAKNVKGGVMKTQYPFPVNASSFQRTAVAFSSSDIYVPDNDEKKSEAENMAMAIQTMKEYAEALKESQQNQNEYENEI